MKSTLMDFFTELNKQITLTCSTGDYKTKTLSEKQNIHRQVYFPFLPENYPTSYANPAYCGKCFGETGPLLATIFYQTLLLKELVYHQDCFAVKLVEYFKSIELISQNRSFSKAVLDIKIREFSFELQEYDLNKRILGNYGSGFPKYLDVIYRANLFSIEYLYDLNIYVTENERKLSQYLSKFHQSKIDEIAQNLMAAYIRAYPRNSIDRDGRTGIGIEAIAGMERITRALIFEIKKKGYRPFISKLESTKFNEQMLYDQKDNDAVYLSADHIVSYQKQIQISFANLKEFCRDYSGCIWFTSFGSPQFKPQATMSPFVYSPEQIKIKRKMQRCFFTEREKYIPEKNRNFSIIGFPSPEIHPEFETIFDKFIQINNRDDSEIITIQKTLCDELDKGLKIRITGKNDNQTRLCIHLQDLQNSEKESLFFNCGADANIPAGEVFTTPRLENTCGILHIKEIQLNDVHFKNLKLVFDNGMVSDFSCMNFDDPEENRKLIADTLFSPHQMLPMGEFAIGTNTLAYAVSRKYGIVNKLNTLFIEKMGPHIALGDTCYSGYEDIPAFNPDGKEVTARDNEISIKRKENVNDAYYDTHIDISIPFDEILEITVIKENLDEIPIMKNGLFVLKGTEILNQPLTEQYNSQHI